jgi:hypothetical protein
VSPFLAPVEGASCELPKEKKVMGGYALLEWLLVNCSRRKMVSEVYAGLSDMTWSCQEIPKIVSGFA